MLTNRQVLFAKIEAIYGTDPVPAATDAILAGGINFTPITEVTVDRNFALPWFGNRGKIIAATYGKLEFDVEIAGSGAAGTAPRYGVLDKACGLSETISAGVSVAYAPASASLQSAALYYHEDGHRYIILGSRGSKTLKFTAQGIPVQHYSLTCLRGTYSDIALPTPALPAPVAVPVNQANTTFTLGGYAAPFDDLSIDYGRDVKYINRPNNESVQIVGGKITGTVTIEKTLLATKNWYTAAGTYIALAVTHGTVAGNKFQLAASNVQITNVDHSDSNGIAMIKLGLEFVPTAAGNDELTVTVL